MEIKITKVTGWTRALNAARTTVHKEAVDKEPSENFKRSLLLAEHSPIRLVEFDIELKGIPSFVATHLARHHEGCEKFVATMRDDRGANGVVTRDTPVDMIISANAQALINISRKRLCGKAHYMTRNVWRNVIFELYKVDEAVERVCVPECVYRGFCPEKHSCGWCESIDYAECRKGYMQK